MWLGAATLVDLTAIQNFSAVDTFLPAPGSINVAAHVVKAGSNSLRFIMRRNAAEENARIFEAWEWTQIGLAIAFFFLILFGERPPASALVIVPVILIILVLERLVISPNVVGLGRVVDDIPAKELIGNPTVARFWAFQGFYEGCEIVKMLLGLGVGARLMIRRTVEKAQRQTDREMAGIGGASAVPPERRIRKKRVTDQNG